MRLPTVFATFCCLVLAAGVAAQPANKPPASQKKEAPASASKSEPPPAKGEAPPPKLNACGCYEDSSGLCHCTPKKSHCGCPGECEPNGCEEKRQKELAKESEEEVKRQREDDKKRNAELAKKRDDEERKEAQKKERSLRGLRLVEPQ
jgi:hypothetical protein